MQDEKQLYKALDEYYSTKDLKDLCFEMKIPYEDLAGEQRSSKARELVQYANRRGRLDELAVHVYSQLEQMSQEETTETNQEEIVRLLESIQTDVESLLTAVGDNTNKEPAIAIMQNEDAVKLKGQLDTYYNLNELRMICFDLDIDYDKLAGDEKSSKINSLVAYVAKSKQIDDLTAYIYRTRPHLKPKTPKPESATPKPSPALPKSNNTPPEPAKKVKKTAGPILRTEETAKLAELLDESYSTNELSKVCFDLNIDYEESDGEEKYEKIDSIIAYAVKVEKVAELTDYIYRTRPFSKSKTESSAPKPSPNPPKPSNTAPEPASKTEKTGGPIKKFLRSLFGHS